ncbi:MAG: hypothetical protein R6T83_09880 [Salinibacter sp.]
MNDDTRADASSRRSWRRWVAGLFFSLFFVAILWVVINPYRGQDYGEIPHGDHVHYVPKERNSDVPINRFPTEPPEPGERITPDGEVIPDPSARENDDS